MFSAFRPNSVKDLLRISIVSFFIIFLAGFLAGIKYAYSIGRDMETAIPGSSQSLGSAMSIAMVIDFSPNITASLFTSIIIIFNIYTLFIYSTRKNKSQTPPQINNKKGLILTLSLLYPVILIFLTSICNIISLLGGSVCAYFSFGVTINAFFTTIADYFLMEHLGIGAIKSLIFGSLISLISLIVLKINRRVIRNNKFLFVILFILIPCSHLLFSIFDIALMEIIDRF